jgi:hypothetical protein
MQGYSFFNIGLEFIDSPTLSENVLANPAGAPKFAIVVGFNFYEHRNLLLGQWYRDRPRLAIPTFKQYLGVR